MRVWVISKYIKQKKTQIIWKENYPWIKKSFLHTDAPNSFSNLFVRSSHFQWYLNALRCRHRISRIVRCLQIYRYILKYRGIGQPKWAVQSSAVSRRSPSPWSSLTGKHPWTFSSSCSSVRCSDQSHCFLPCLAAGRSSSDAVLVPQLFRQAVQHGGHVTQTLADLPAHTQQR